MIKLFLLISVSLLLNLKYIIHDNAINNVKKIRKEDLVLSFVQNNLPKNNLRRQLGIASNHSLVSHYFLERKPIFKGFYQSKIIKTISKRFIGEIISNIVAFASESRDDVRLLDTQFIRLKNKIDNIQVEQWEHRSRSLERDAMSFVYNWLGFQYIMTIVVFKQILWLTYRGRILHF